MIDPQSVSRDRLLSLFERLPDEDRGEVIHLVEFLARKADPVAWALDNAPIDDEPLTSEEEAALRKAEEDVAAGRLTSSEELRAELGL